MVTASMNGTTISTSVTENTRDRSSAETANAVEDKTSPSGTESPNYRTDTNSQVGSTDQWSTYGRPAVDWRSTGGRPAFAHGRPAVDWRLAGGIQNQLC